MTILVTGARGNIGRRVLAKLAEAGYPVRGSAREIARLDVPEGAGRVRLDITDPSDAGEALRGVHAVFLYPTRGPAPAEFLAAAREAGVEYVVLLSSPDVYEGAPDSPIRLAHLVVERALAESGLRHTVIYPGALASNASRDWAGPIRARGRVGIAYADAQCNPIHEDDIADVVAWLLTDRAYPGRMLALTGPESMRLRDMVGILGAELGRAIPIDELTRRQAMEQREPWMPAAVLDVLLDGAAASVGVPAPINNTVSRLTGHPARTFRQWVGEHRADFLPVQPVT